MNKFRTVKVKEVKTPLNVNQKFSDPKIKLSSFILSTRGEIKEIIKKVRNYCFESKDTNKLQQGTQKYIQDRHYK